MSRIAILRAVGILLVTVGILFQLIRGIALGGGWLIAGMTIAACGLGFYAKAMRKPWYSVLLAFIPVLGPIVVLAVYERDDSASSALFLKARALLTRWGVVFVGLGLGTLLIVGLLEFPCDANSMLRSGGILIAVLGGLMVILLRPAYLVLLAVLGILSAIQIPGFLNYQSRARQSEAKAQLGRLFDEASSRKAAHGSYAISEMSQLPHDQAHRYSLWYAVNGVPTRIAFPAGIRCEPCNDTPPSSVKVAASATGFTAAARGNIDGDPICDEWSINDARELKNTLNDLIERESP